jgi:hypothetical protein
MLDGFFIVLAEIYYTGLGFTELATAGTFEETRSRAEKSSVNSV